MVSIADIRRTLALMSMEIPSDEVLEEQYFNRAPVQCDMTEITGDPQATIAMIAQVIIKNYEEAGDGQELK